MLSFQYARGSEHRGSVIDWEFLHYTPQCAWPGLLIVSSGDESKGRAKSSCHKRPRHEDQPIRVLETVSTGNCKTNLNATSEDANHCRQTEEIDGQDFQRAVFLEKHLMTFKPRQRQFSGMKTAHPMHAAAGRS